jgi:nitronate monooxygenase
VIVNRIVRALEALEDQVPAFPFATEALAPLMAAAGPARAGDFIPMWCGQAARLGRELPAGELTRRLAQEALSLISLSRGGSSVG